jgi:pimeloyl-ACP methyl ester carboxylesterase
VVQVRTKIRRIALALAAAVAAGGTMWAILDPLDATANDIRAMNWTTCPAYSDEVLGALFPGKAQAARLLVNRLSCGTVSVPQDYRAPRGRQVTIAVTRLPATDRAHRLGRLALNPGGPGGSGYLMPVKLSLGNATAARLNERYDLIGFDPRGVGNSTKVECPLAPTGPGVWPLTEANAQSAYDTQVQQNQNCAQVDRAFLAQIGTVTIARDLDQLRIALRDKTLNYFGGSWGTYLGAVYRSMYPDNVGRMFLDSVTPPTASLVTASDQRADATERDALRQVAWIAARDATYGLGSTADQVQRSILALQADYDSHPRTFIDMPQPVDGAMVAMLTIQPSPLWAQVAQVYKDLRAATTGGPTPASLLEFLSGGQTGGSTPPPDGMPETNNATMQLATQCMDDPYRPTFAEAWATFQKRVASHALTGRALSFEATCAGWPITGTAYQLRGGGGSLVLAGHRWESTAPYEMAEQMQATIGGKLFTVDDDVHGSVSRVDDCAADLVNYFTTGKIDRGCAGIPSA